MIALLRAGLIKPTDALIGRLQAPRYGQAVRQVALGELAFRQGRTKEAIQTLQPVVESISHSDFEVRLLGAMTLSDALLTEGRTSEALASLESATARRGCGGFYSARFWPFVRRHLMDVYRRAGREVEAAQINA
jgi:predicted Zn-dependent protease